METLETSETVIEGLVTSKHVEIGNIIRGKLQKSFNLGKEKCVDPVDSSSHGDDNIKGISLCVALTGGVTNKSDQQSIRDVGQHEFKVNEGDLVWATIKKKQKQSWWPAIVCDGSNAQKEALNWPTREDDCLVRCFGNGDYIWCSVCEVKPFVGYFDRVRSQSKAKKFLDALDKAVVELDQRVKTEFTCSCFSNIKMEKDGNIGDLSVTRFEPVKFLDYIRDLARVIYVPNKIDYVVRKNCLFAFYRSLGHLEIPMDQLMLTFASQTEIKPEEENLYFDDDFEKCEKQSERRGRRKSRFLLYPGECGIKDEESMMDVNEGVDLTKNYGQSQSLKKAREKWSRKNKGVQVNVCSSEVLCQLQFAAQDCYFPCESKNFDSVERFISGFKKWAFNDSQIPTIFHFMNEFGSAQPCFTQNHGELQAGLGPTRSGHMPKNRGRKRKNINLQANLGSTIIQDFTVNHGEHWVGLGPTGSGHGPALGHVPKKRGRKRKNINLHAYPCPTIIHDFTVNHGEPRVGLGPPLSGHGPPGSGHVPKKRGGKRKIINLQANPNSKDNGTYTKTEKRLKIKEVGVPCIDLSYNKVNQDNVKEFKSTTFLLKFSPDHPLPSNQDLNSVFSKYGALIESETQVFTEKLSGQVVFLDSCSAGGAFWGLQNDKPFGPVLVNFKIQHLSGDESMVFKTPIKNPSGLFKPNTNSTEIKIVKSKTIEEIPLSSIDNEEVRGTSLRLKFSPTHKLPNFQDLNLVFCKYGELNEFETRVSGQNLTGQVIFVNPSSAENAIQRLEKDRPFGPALLSYRVHHVYNVESAIRVKSPVNIPLKLERCQDLGGLKKNLEMMNLMLEINGDSLSLEMREKLESEIKGLMKKVSAMDGSSSCL